MLSKLLKEIGCIKFGDFILSSGKRSSYYVDIKKAITNPEVLEMIGKEIAKRVYEDKIAGIELGSVPIASVVSVLAKKPLVIIRKKPKDYGTMSKIEGEIKEGEKVLIVEDVTTTGNSVIKAINEVREAGGIVERVIVVVDREEGAEENLKKIGVKLEPLVRVSEIKD
ncbi:orotate phosphoribosyltransferase [Methanocaldococcus infernus ME]|uniref:Orotate phosphoribosyltransferase n=1 Tax=Methanocaldococcus infernus (strain DSM 11812 / JCM 15783 / ME) TaxID=573063 RepID=D5VS05_METIM|nr:orotate phosphoribosyltransferase [Methanocaldococcus infernus]ADG13358.1 orotate phosphoribosyltransferase [Methanocaldococcus infernus ME]